MSEFYVIARPGTKYGPCNWNENCSSGYCAALKAKAEELCAGCGTVIGYDTAFCRDKLSKDGEETKERVWHLSCAPESQLTEAA